MADNKKKSVASQPTLGDWLGNKFVELIPSSHKDPKRAKEQERGARNVLGLVDLFIPQTKEDIAIDLALTTALGPLAKPAKRLAKLSKNKLSKRKKSALTRYLPDWDEEIQKLTGNAPSFKEPLYSMKKGQKWLSDWMTARKHLPTFAEDESISGLGGLFNSSRSVKIAENKVPTKIMDKNPFKEAEVGEALAHYRLDNKNVEIHPMFQDEFYNEAYAKRANLSPKEYLESLGVHEYTHALTHGDALLSPRVKNYINKMKESAYGKFGGPDGRIYDFSNQQWMDATTRRITYLEQPTEAYARVMQIRKELNLNPMRMDNVLDESKLFKTNEPYTELREIYGHNEIENMVNNLPAIMLMDMKLEEPKNENKTTKTSKNSY